ncbi:MAG: hypothetical protein HQL35_16160, partial [Alphaproteobacteria bacterium]|nr:hypothetical protein [Alphaproteobacteria bacterium]
MMRAHLTPARAFLGLRHVLHNDQMLMALLAAVVGAATGLAVVGFRQLIQVFHARLFGAVDERIYDTVAALPWWQVLTVPTLGGLVVGILVHRFL